MQRDRIGTWEVSGLAAVMLREQDGPHREGEEPKPMMHGHEKSDLVIVAVKPTNKAKKAPAEASAGAVAAVSVERRAGAKGNTHQQSTYWTQSQARVSQALERIRQLVPSHTRGRSRMRESRTYGSGRGACHETHVPTATTARVIRLIFSPVKWALLALKVSGKLPPRHFGFILRSRFHSITSSASTSSVGATDRPRTRCRPTGTCQETSFWHCRTMEMHDFPFRAALGDNKRDTSGIAKGLAVQHAR